MLEKFFWLFHWKAFNVGGYSIEDGISSRTRTGGIFYSNHYGGLMWSLRKHVLLGLSCTEPFGHKKRL